MVFLDKYNHNRRGSFCHRFNREMMLFLLTPKQGRRLKSLRKRLRLDFTNSDFYETIAKCTCDSYS